MVVLEFRKNSETRYILVECVRRAMPFGLHDEVPVASKLSP